MTQATALAILKTGGNVFLTGEPGAGKTYTVNCYTSWLREHGIAPAITASTGIAATHIGGMTIHSWSGIGIKKRLTGEDFGRMLENDKLVLRLANTQVLIIDEISMLDARTLEAVDGVCRSLRRDGRPFGGMQVVFVGDFFQLPPVAGAGEELPEFAYASSAWQEAAPTVCYLSEQHRQNDDAFLSLLASLRRGEVTEDARDLLQQCQSVPEQGAHHTRLFTHNVDVDQMNAQRLAELPGEDTAFEMESQGNRTAIEALIKSCLSPSRLALKVGARVMFTKNNFEEGYVNGTLGEVARFDDEDGAPMIRTIGGRMIKATSMEWAIMDGNRTIAKIKQLPLRLAWAITVHKSQGMTLDAAVMDLSRAFEYGQGYVALSRVKTSAGLSLIGWNERALQVHPEILESDEGFRKQSRIAQTANDTLTAQDQSEAERQFILACGGTMEKVEPVIVEIKKSAAPKGATYEQTLVLLKEGKNIAEIATIRELVPSTICNHVEKLVSQGKIGKEDVLRIVPAHLHEALPRMHELLKAGEGHLGPAFEKGRGKYSYDDLRFARMVM